MKIDASSNIQKPEFLLENKNIQKENMFDKIYQASIDVIEETNAYQKAAEQAQMEFVTGKTDNMLDVVMAQEKAMVSLNFTVQVTNKVLESYQKIMQIQV